MGTRRRKQLSKEELENKILCLSQQYGFTTHVAVSGVYLRTKNSRGWYINTLGTTKLYHENNLGAPNKSGTLPFHHIHKEFTGSRIEDMLEYINNHDHSVRNFGIRSEKERTKKEHR